MKIGDTARVRELLDYDPSLANARTATGESAALMAAYYKRSAIAALLIERGAQLSLFEAAALGQEKTVRNWIDTDSALLNALSPDGFTALALASYFGHSDVVLYLLMRGAEVNAVSSNGMRVMPMHAAAAGGHVAIVRAIIAHGGDVNAAQHMGHRPLHSAAQAGNAEMARLLIEQGADPALANDAGQTALDIARQHQHDELVELLGPLT